MTSGGQLVACRWRYAAASPSATWAGAGLCRSDHVNDDGHDDFAADSCSALHEDMPDELI